MKIGILTFHRAHNYGAVLQCYALQKTINGLGHKADVIDYRQPFIEYYYNLLSRKRIKGVRGLLGYIWHFPERYRIVKRKGNIFNSFVKDNIILSKTCREDNIQDDYDAIVIGSDQLWSKSCLGGKFDPVYWGDFPKKKSTRLVGYAISSNRESINDLCGHHLTKLNNFQNLSLREQYSIDVLSQHTDKKLYHCIDPTLLTDSATWDSLVNEKYKSEKYVALYQVRFPYGKEMLKEKANALALKCGFRLIDLSDVSYSVNDFISIIKYAQCVVTSSFHATAFSIIFGTPLFAYRLNDGKDDRYTDLLNDLGMSDSVVDIKFIPSFIPKAQDKNDINERLKKYRKASIDFLQSSLRDNML